VAFALVVRGSANGIPHVRGRANECTQRQAALEEFRAELAAMKHSWIAAVEACRITTK
jgi:hypothetical protein